MTNVIKNDDQNINNNNSDKSSGRRSSKKRSKSTKKSRARLLRKSRIWNEHISRGMLEKKRKAQKSTGGAPNRRVSFYVDGVVTSVRNNTSHAPTGPSQAIMESIQCPNSAYLYFFKDEYEAMGGEAVIAEGLQRFTDNCRVTWNRTSEYFKMLYARKAVVELVSYRDNMRTDSKPTKRK